MSMIVPKMAGINLQQPSGGTSVLGMAGGGKFRLGDGDPLKMGFMPIPVKNQKKALYLIIVGKQGTGKNTLAYSAIEEGPVCEISIIERGTEGDEHIQQYTQKGILRKTYVIDAADPLSSEESIRIFSDWQKTMYSLYDWEGTVILNTIDEIYDIARKAIIGKMEKVVRREYGDVNRAMNDILYYFTRVECKTNLILLSKGYDVWVNGENTGLMDYKGFPNAKYMSDGMISLDKVTFRENKKDRSMDVIPIPERFSGTITRCPAAMKHEGLVVRGADLKFVPLKKRMLAL